jgi:aconitate hydratase
MWRDATLPDGLRHAPPDLGGVQPSLAGPRLTQDRVLLSQADEAFEVPFRERLQEIRATRGTRGSACGADYSTGHGDVVIATITSCATRRTVLVAAGLVARAKARRHRADREAVGQDQPRARIEGRLDYFAASKRRTTSTVGFNLVGYGCTTCIGNSGPAARAINDAISSGDLVACSVRCRATTFEACFADVRARHLASPPRSSSPMR